MLTLLLTPRSVRSFLSAIEYSTSLKKELNAPVLQWIDSSFVTKKTKPGDIDIVTYADYRSIEAAKKNLADFKYPSSLLSLK